MLVLGCETSASVLFNAFLEIPAGYRYCPASKLASSTKTLFGGWTNKNYGKQA